ncbi:MAG: hypothetical protein M9894_38460 [Planctomycetes bacterium]|nr:hypothetical protein [Planctomycetota bacterium]
MSSPPRRPLLLLALALPGLAGCWASGQRKPLFGTAPDGAPAQAAPPPARPAAPAAPPPARQRQQDAPEAALLRDLRRSETDLERKRIADALVKRGAPARALVQQARDEEGLLLDLLDDVLRRLDEGAPPSPRGRAVQTAWVEEKYALALDRYLAGDTWGALRLVDAILALEPGAEQRPKLLRLRRRARERVLRESVLLADLVPSAGSITPSEPLRARVRLTNVGREPVSIRVADGALGLVSVEYEELGQDGRRTRTRTERPLPAPARIDLPPGRSAELPLELPAPHATLARHLVGRFQLGGRLRAHTLLIGDAPYPFFVPLLPCDVLVLHPPDLELGKDPRAALHAAVSAGNQVSAEAQRDPARRAFVAALLVGREAPEVGVALVVAALEGLGGPGPLEDALCAAMARLTGEPLGFTRAEWLAWWRLQRSRPERLREAREPPADEPEDEEPPRQEEKRPRRGARRGP